MKHNVFRPSLLAALLPGPRTPRWPDGERFVEVMNRGGITFELYAPLGHDPQQPHTRDEIYVVAAGRARFDLDGEVHDVQAGDAIFVAAGRPHRFFDFGDDFSTWVIFFGPEAISDDRRTP